MTVAPATTRRRHARLAGALLLALLVAGTALFARLPGTTLLWSELQNVAHLPAFGVVAVALLVALRAWRPALAAAPFAGYLAAAAAAFLLGTAVEFAQPLVKASAASPADIGSNAAGILLALALYAVFDPRLRGRWLRLGRGARPAVVLACGLLLAWLLAPLAGLAVAVLQRGDALPVVADFTAPWTTRFVALNNARLSPPTLPAGAAAGRLPGLVRLDLAPGRYPGIALEEPYPDWSGYDTLVVTVYSPAPLAGRLVLRVHDRRHDQRHADRFNRVLSLGPGLNTIRIPLTSIAAAPAGRRLDLHDIGGIILFIADLEQPLALHLGRLRLEGERSGR